MGIYGIGEDSEIREQSQLDEKPARGFLDDVDSTD